MTLLNCHVNTLDWLLAEVCDFKPLMCTKNVTFVLINNELISALIVSRVKIMGKNSSYANLGVGPCYSKKIIYSKLDGLYSKLATVTI